MILHDFCEAVASAESLRQKARRSGSPYRKTTYRQVLFSNQAPRFRDGFMILPYGKAGSLEVFMPMGVTLPRHMIEVRFAPRLSPGRHGPRLFPSVASLRAVAADSRHAARRVREAVGKGTRTQRRQHRQPDGQGDPDQRHAGVRRGEKKSTAIKRHILVDTLGLLLAVVVHAANIQDRDGAKLVFARAQAHGAMAQDGARSGPTAAMRAN